MNLKKTLNFSDLHTCKLTNTANKMFYQTLMFFNVALF